MYAETWSMAQTVALICRRICFLLESMSNHHKDFVQHEMAMCSKLVFPVGKQHISSMSRILTETPTIFI